MVLRYVTLWAWGGCLGYFTSYFPRRRQVVNASDGTPIASLPIQEHQFVLDFNGDGKTDVVQVHLRRVKVADGVAA